MAKRSPSTRFMPGVWVFPGGGVEEADGNELVYRKAALRELAEETAIDLGDADNLKAWSRWITPTEVKLRYDVRFYVALAPAHTPPKPNQAEIVEAGWFRPVDALSSFHAGEIRLVFPTIKHLEELTGYASADDVLKAAESRSMEPVRPRVVEVGGKSRIVLPGSSSAPNLPK